MVILKLVNMKALLKLNLGLIMAFLLSACHSHSEKVLLTDEQPSIKNNASNMNTVFDETSHHKEGLSEPQIDHYKIVVLPTQVDLVTPTQLPVSHRFVTDTATHQIVNALYDSHRFDVSFSENGNSAKLITDENLTITNSNQAEFYLKSTISQLDSNQMVRILKATGQGVDEKSVFVTVMYQLIEVKTNKIIFNRSLHYQLKSTTYGENMPTTISNTFHNMADLMTHQIVDELYPIRILMDENQHIILDQPLPVGTECDVMQMGNKMKDVYTNSVLGYALTQVGKLVVTQTSSVLSYAAITEGQVAAGDICKILPTNRHSAPELVKRSIHGGVILPFD